PANAVLTPTAIIDDVKHVFCLPTTTTAPPLEEPLPKPPSDALPTSSDLEDLSSVLNMAPDPKDHAKAIMNSTDNSGPHLSSTPNLCPRSRVDAPHVFDENTISQASPSLQNCNFSSTPRTASDWQNVLEIGLDNTPEDAEKVQDLMETWSEDAPTHPAAAKYRFVDVDGVDSLLKANDTFSHIPSLLDTCKSSLRDELRPQEVPAAIPPPFSLEKASIDIPNNLDSDKSTYRKSISDYEPSVLLDSENMLQEVPHAEYPWSDRRTPFTSAHRLHKPLHIDIRRPFGQLVPTAIAALTPHAIIDDVKTSFCPLTTTAAPPFEEPPSFCPPTPRIDAPHTYCADDAIPQAAPRSDAPHTYCADDTIPQAPQTLQDLEFGPTSSSVPPVAPDPSTILKIGIDTTSEGVQKVQDTMEIGLDDELTHPATAKCLKNSPSQLSTTSRRPSGRPATPFIDESLDRHLEQLRPQRVRLPQVDLKL
ncbi:hypothetical protein DXG01_011129, partial [Tephrocybe rancida]